MEKINWICKSDTINNTIVWSCRPRNMENFESTSDKMIGIKVSLKNVSTGGILADGSEGTIIKVATDSQPYLVARIDTPDVIWWYTQNDLKFPSSETLLCLSQLVGPDQRPNSPICLMTMNGTDWFVPNTSEMKRSTHGHGNQIKMTKLNNTYYAGLSYPASVRTLYSSTDARNWQPVINDIFTEWISAIITFKNKLYIGVYGIGFYSSSDGNTWKKHGKNPDDKEYVDPSSLMEMKIINDKLILVYRYYIWEFDETTNTSKKLSPAFNGGGNNTINHLGYDSDKKTYLACCGFPEAPSDKIPLFYWSNDLVNWNKSTGNLSNRKSPGYHNLTNAFGKWWARGNSDAMKLVCSEDGGKTWNEVKAPVDSEGLLFKFGDTLTYCGFNDQPNQIFSTTDGINWKKDVKLGLLMRGGSYSHVSTI